MFKVKSAEIVTSAILGEKMPGERLPEIALLGRSNVGKSSLINGLLQRRSLARTSSQPGKTRLFNFYLINEAFFLVDMPGYGYAKFAQTERNMLRGAIKSYLETRSSLSIVLQLVDFRHPPSQDDIEFNQLLRLSDVPFKVVATKVDKVSRSLHGKHSRAITETLGLAASELLITSAVEKKGYADVWEHILRNIKAVHAEG